MRRGRFVAGVLGGLLLLGACTSIGDDPSVPSPETDVADGDNRATPDDRLSLSPSQTPTATPTPSASPTRAKKKRGSERGGSDKPAGQDDKRPGDAPKDPAVAASGPSASRSDPRADGDSSGERPSYVDIRRASIGGEKKTVTFAVAVEGRIPRPLPGRTNMTASFRLDMPDGSTHNIYAIGDDGGWRAEFDGGSFPGIFSVSGNVFLWELHWRAIGGREFRWFAQTAWTHSPSGPLGETQYYFDRVPEFEAASFPE